MSRTERLSTELDALLATPTPAPGGEQNREERGGRPARGRLEAWLRGGSDAGGSDAEPSMDGTSMEGTAAEDTAVEGTAVHGELRSIPVEAIEPNSFQPRRRFDEESLASLAESIEALGVLQPVLVRAVEDGCYELIAGERRWRAAQRAELRMIPALVRQVGDQGALEQAIVENLHRQDLNPLEEAAAYQELTDEFGLTQDEVARRVGRSRSAVANTLRLLQLPGPVQGLVVAGSLSAGHARALLSMASREAQLALAERVVANEMSVRQTEEAVRAQAERASSTSPSGGGRGNKSVAALEVQAMLEERLETRVEVNEAGRGGRLVIRFADDDDLGRIVRLLVEDKAAGDVEA